MDPPALERMFPFFQKPENLGLITAPRLNFEILTTPPILLAEGGRIDFHIRLKGWAMRWRTRICKYEPPPLRFTDEQLRGSYTYWHHQHGFKAVADGTRRTDRVRYALPSWLPSAVERARHDHFVALALHDIFDYQASVFRRLFDADRRPQGDERS